LQREPKASLAANNLAMLYLNYKNDKASLDRAVKLGDIIGNSTDPALIDTRGWIKYKAGDYSGALPLLQQASKASPNNRVMKYHVGMAQLKLNNVAEAKANLQAALKDNQPFAGMDEAAKALASMAKK
jgi:tetratricopeptide (TPR) repeat protein